MDNQFNLFTPAADSECNARNMDDSFACCSRFRQCSNAGHCLISDEEYSNGCSYRKNLENGRIFYGKNATGFSLSEYHDFCTLVDGLSEETRTEYFRILVYFWYSKLAASVVLWDISPALQTLFDVKLCESASCVDHFLSMCNDKKLRNRLSENPEFGSLWKNIPTGEKGEKRTKDFLCNWIKANAAPFLSPYTSVYALVSLNPKYRSYSYEYYYDYLRGHEKCYVTTLPKERDDFNLFNG